MNSNYIRSITMTSVVILGVLFFVSNMLGGTSNNIGDLAKLLLLINFIIGLSSVKVGLYLLMVYAMYSDLLKRSMILDFNFGLIDIAFVLSLPLILVFALILKKIASILTKNNRLTIWEKITFSIATAFCVLSLGSIYLKSGFSVTNIQLAANVAAYSFLPFLFINTFKRSEEIYAFIRYCLIIMIPCVLYGIKQWLYGFSQFEIDYLNSGATILAFLVDLENPRPFSTVANPGSFGAVCMFGLALSVYALTQKNYLNDIGKKNQILPKIISLLLSVVFLTALLGTRIRSIWIAFILSVILWVAFKYKWSTRMAYIGGSIFGITMILSADYILDKNLLSYWTKSLVSLFGSSDFTRQAVELQTWSERLKGYKDILSQPNEWPLFWGEQIPDDITVHDDLSKILYTFGAIPAAVLSIIALVMIIKLHKVLLTSTSLKSYTRNLATFGLGIYIALLTRGLLAGNGTHVFPTNVIMYVSLSLAIVAIVNKNEAKNTTQIEDDQ